MVIANRRGSSAMGCVVWLLLLGASVYFGSRLGKMYWRFYAYQQEMESQARLAPSLTDQTIRTRLYDRAEELNLPAGAERVRIQRTLRPRRIIIDSEYRDSVDLPFLKRGFDFHPHAEEAL